MGWVKFCGSFEDEVWEEGCDLMDGVWHLAV